MWSRPSLPWTRCGAPVAATCNAVVCDAPAGAAVPSDAPAMAARRHAARIRRITGIRGAQQVRAKVSSDPQRSFALAPALVCLAHSQEPYIDNADGHAGNADRSASIRACAALV